MTTTTTSTDVLQTLTEMERSFNDAYLKAFAASRCLRDDAVVMDAGHYTQAVATMARMAARMAEVVAESRAAEVVVESGMVDADDVLEAGDTLAAVASALTNPRK